MGLGNGPEWLTNAFYSFEKTEVTFWFCDLSRENDLRERLAHSLLNLYIFKGQCII